MAKLEKKPRKCLKVMHILDQEVPNLALRLKVLQPSNQRSIFARASLLTASKLRGLDGGTSRLLDALKTQGDLTSEQARSAMALSETLDDRYFDLQQKGACDQEWGKLFSGARLVRGLAVGFGASAKEDIADAVYELIKALDDPSEVITFIQSQLDSIDSVIS